MCSVAAPVALWAEAHHSTLELGLSCSGRGEILEAGHAGAGGYSTQLVMICEESFYGDHGDGRTVSSGWNQCWVEFRSGKRSATLVPRCSGCYGDWRGNAVC